ncbi:MAG: STAS domain-containing protein [Tissierellia bacterium]|nr:STAS domain-containing protein [Tissierellia bacterium]
MALDYEITTKNEEMLIHLKGDLDIYSCNQFKEDVNKQVKENPMDLIIDTHELEYIDSTGLGVLISIYKNLKEFGHKITIVGLKPNVKKIFLITDLDKIFTIKE